jgi:HD superfamily phosphodiesterase
MDPVVENKLKERVRLLLMRGRKADWEHTLRAVEYGKYLLRHEEGDEEIVIPALYLHDIGWSNVDFDDFRKASPQKKKEVVSVSLHMRNGAALAREILDDLGWDPKKTQTIVSIIEIHDETDKILALDDPSAILIIEADRMDRYGPESINRFKAMLGENYFNEDHRKNGAAYLREGLSVWFRTRTGKELAERLARKTGLLS